MHGSALETGRAAINTLNNKSPCTYTLYTLWIRGRSVPGIRYTR